MGGGKRFQRRAVRCAPLGHGGGYYVQVIQRGAEIDNITGFDKEHEAVEWIKTKSQAWLLRN